MKLLSTFDANLLLNSVLYSTIGIIILLISFFIVEKLTPKHSLWKEVVENKNLALAFVAGCFILGISIIIASAIH